MGQRFTYIDQLKGFAMILVVAGHVMEFCLYNKEYSFLHDIIYSFHMPLFAFLSGLVSTTLFDYKQVAIKIAKQSCRLLVPFFSMGIVYICTIRSGESFLFQPFKQGLWYLLFLWECYFISHIYNVCLFGKLKKRTYLFDVCWVAIVFVTVKLMIVYCSVEFNNIVGTLHLLRLYPFFFLGCIFRRMKCLPPQWKINPWIPSAFCIIWIILLWNIKVIPGKYLFKFSFVIETSAIFPIVFIFSKYGNRMNKRVSDVMIMFGKYSLGIYMFHRFMTDTLNLYIIGDYIHLTGSYFVEFILVFTIALLMCFLSVGLVKVLSYNNFCSFLLLGNMDCLMKRT